jgi:hypothetical protein
MIIGPSMITHDRMRIVKYSEGLYNNEAAILSSPSRRKFYKDVLEHFRNLDEPTWLFLLSATLIVAFVICLIQKITFLKAFWMVSKAVLYKREYILFMN